MVSVKVRGKLTTD